MGESIIKNDLRTMKSYDFYMKHIVKSNNWYFSNYLQVPPDEFIDRMDYFREIVSSKLGINFYSIQMVGSAKTGYSLSPQKLLQPFHDDSQEEKSSDIDIAIISDKLFLLYWDKLRKVRELHNQYYYQYITKSIYRGYVDGANLLKIDSVRGEWSNKVSPINKDLQDKLQFVHPITYRIYRNWEDLEEYQIQGIEIGKAALEKEESNV